MSEHPSFPGGIFPLIEEQPSGKAELRIFLIDPEGRRMPVRWLSNQGGGDGQNGDRSQS